MPFERLPVGLKAQCQCMVRLLFETRRCERLAAYRNTDTAMFVCPTHKRKIEKMNPPSEKRGTKKT